MITRRLINIVPECVLNFKRHRNEINAVTLSFRSDETEQTFCNEITGRSIKLTRLSLLLAIAILLVFGIFEKFIIPDRSITPQYLRFAGVGFFTLIILHVL